MFCTLYPQGKQDDLFRDPGQIPYTLAKNYSDVQAELVTCADVHDSALDRVERFRTIRIGKRIHNGSLAGLWYLLLNAKRIDWLNLYHCRKQTLLLARFYKLLYKKGKVYVKLDAGLQTVQKLEENPDYLELFHKLENIADLISTESQVAVERISRLSNKSIHCVPNGVYLKPADEGTERENIFLTVARIGSPEKNDDLLMEAFAKISDQCDWKLILVGNIKQGFSSFINEYFEKHSMLKDRVLFTGPIYDRKDLATVYSRAKVFVLPSAFENYSLACVEALCNGCYVILSDQVTPYREFTNDFRYGTISEVNNVGVLAEKLLEATRNMYTRELHKSIVDYANSLFSWELICEKLYDALNK